MQKPLLHSGEGPISREVSTEAARSMQPNGGGHYASALRTRLAYRIKLLAAPPSSGDRQLADVDRPPARRERIAKRLFTFSNSRYDSTTCWYGARFVSAASTVSVKGVNAVCHQAKSRSSCRTKDSASSPVTAARTFSSTIPPWATAASMTLPKGKPWNTRLKKVRGPKVKDLALLR